MKRDPRRVWMIVTADRYELAMGIGDTTAELAAVVGISESYISRCYHRSNRVPVGAPKIMAEQYRVRMVMLED